MTDRDGGRLSADHWIAEGLRALTEEGPRGLKADRLATRLSVSRGSFYWHFKNVADFHDALLAHWRRVTTERVISRLEEDRDPHSRLTALLSNALRSDDELERAIRAWSTEETTAADAVQQVDARRLDFIRAQFLAAALSPRAANARAQFIYWTYLGRVMTPARAGDEIDANEIIEIAERLLDASG